ncbi:MAG: cupin domain-containing protein [Chloroflexi bacterium HGW-Chloroflexi-4]|jgi:quercetin dioxygenase-like cupin family protein|nr:MAG: cupin domain-containing protein [Methanobacteriales archaeon HGW-Methanobacteriales-2]PKN99122.1 MAG: cupin domain-containing protein [Chloroflexi bacterium HGW-Chloroflexi-4]
MFYHNDKQEYREIMPGIKVKTLVYGDKSLLVEFLMAKNSKLDPHSHPEEQNGYLVSGRMRLYFNGEVHEVFPGDSWNVPGNLEHSGDILEDSVVIGVFAPVRQSYLAYHPNKA